ncbi:hypothetical protein BO94DRAFT_9337 [Aspergillus sclerotioniger CBS 115572]|uniref:HRQ family protein n=1 Tax=Aspergillus sclerotioniger CBS 115572 TaxID=1450535 RepID=A0A317XF49_9EURO|nr:hypothetical protein BO94DRAFT_9337 [Aspergillus sclerotioniger CBS 115572]PWY96422.1 hypothetical protein BO94DRAFT_9337 [Aspergillus sclerotioniger CBS 115572]
MDVLIHQGNLWLVGLAMVALGGFYFVTGKLQGSAILSRVCSHWGSKGGWQSWTAEKKSSPGPSSPATYVDILPPQRRHVLASFKIGVPYEEVDEKDVVEYALPMTSNYQTCTDKRYTPTGFSAAEVRALGDFPDYAELSGVPLPEPYHEFDIGKALARPYRPFRWSYHQTMSLTKLETDWWIELENTYRERIAQRKELYAKHGSSVLGYLPGSELACKELMEMVLQFICARYPQYFVIEDNRILHNKILGTKQDLKSKHPLDILIDNVPEDFGIMLRDEKTGFYFLRAGVICSSLGWNVGTKIGLQLHEIHETIPDYKEKMQFSMDRFFTKMPVDKPIQRGSWGLEVGQPLYMPKGDPHETLRLSQDPNLQLEDCNLRVDWQTLRRLPLSAAVVFNFKALFTPVTEFRDEPGVPALTAKVLKEGKKNLMDYKGTWHVEHVVIPNLEKWAAEQEESGLVPKDWQVATLDDSPWFKGWQEKWHRQQGF